MVHALELGRGDEQPATATYRMSHFLELQDLEVCGEFLRRITGGAREARPRWIVADLLIGRVRRRTTFVVRGVAVPR
jgi:hypothetical protein